MEAAQARRAELGFARALVLGRHALAAHREADPLRCRLGDRRAGARLRGQGTHGAVRVGARGDPERDVETDRHRRERVVAQDAARKALVGDHDPLFGGSAQNGVVEADVLDDPVHVLEGDPVPDPQRLRDREHHAGDEVGERLARGEAEDRGRDRPRGQQRRRQPAEAGELVQREEEPDHDDRRDQHAPHEAQPCVDDLRVDAGEHAVAALERAMDSVGHGEGHEDRNAGGDPRRVRARGREDAAKI
jgi:hypothetical protein